MRNILVLAVIGIIAFTGCKQPTPVKTIENLKAGFKGETTASAKYAAFALKAKEEGHEAVAKLFEAASKAEGIHAKNHQKVLEDLGAKADDFKPEFEVKITLENLQSAVEGETYEINTMYPQFLADAKTENVKKATKSFTWAFDTEKKHQQFYQNAIQAINAMTENTLPAGYVVCPTCGNTYDSNKVDDKCAFCQTSKDKFISI